jgi:hypothetical protein
VRIAATLPPAELNVAGVWKGLIGVTPPSRTMTTRLRSVEYVAVYVSVELAATLSMYEM